MIQRGIATFGLDYGQCPRWLFERMVKLGRSMVRLIAAEEGPEAFIKRIADPVWFQSLGTVLAFDWNASGLTTILTAALKEAIRGQERELGIFICGGKGKTSKKTPAEIETWGERLSLPEPKVNNLVYNSRMAAKVDSALVQDGFQIYHHTMFVALRPGSGLRLRDSGSKSQDPKVSWTVVQQGMNPANQTARRYHWHSDKITDLVCEPHSGIVSLSAGWQNPTLNLTAKASGQTREVSAELIRAGYRTLMKDIQILRRHFSKISQTLALKFKDEEITFMNLENVEFSWHPVLTEDFTKSKYLEKILWKLCDEKPENYEKILAAEGVGPKTIRALALVSEVIYGAKPSYQDPARYSFAHGGKDATPYPIDRQTYDETIQHLKRYAAKIKNPAIRRGFC